MRFQKLATALALVLGTSTAIVASIPGDAVAGDDCRRMCDEMKEDRDAICRGLKTPKARRRCWESSMDQYAKCVKRCADGPLRGAEEWPCWNARSNTRRDPAAR